MNLQFFIPCITSNHFCIGFLLLLFQPGIKVIHGRLFYAFLHYFLLFPPGIFSLIDPATTSQLMQAPFFAAFLHQFPDLPRRQELDSGRIQKKSDARKTLTDLRASLTSIKNPKGKELTTNALSLSVRRQFSKISWNRPEL